MDTITLDAMPRTVLGKKVRHLRRTGIIPVNVFGHNLTSAALEVNETAMERALMRAGTNALITLSVAGSDGTRPVLVRGYHRRPTTGKLLHVDLYHVSMTETLRTEVPIELIGTPPALDLGGMLLKNLDSIEVECLPGDLVSSIEVDVSGLTEMDQAILVSDLKVSAALTILADPETVVVKIMPPAKEEVEEEAAEAAEEGDEEADGEKEEDDKK